MTSLLLRLAFVTLSALLFRPAGMAAQLPDAPPQLYRVYFVDWDDLARLSGELDVWEVNHTDGYLVTALLPAQVEALGHDRRVEPSLSPTWPPKQPIVAATGGIPGFSCYRTVAESYADMDALAAAYPALAKVVDIGDTWDKVTPGGPPGDDLRVVILTSPVRSYPKPRLFLMGGIHARELVTSETVLRFAERLLTGYGVDPDATWMLDHTEAHILVAANPDGRIKAEEGYLWRKNTNSADGCTTNSPPYFSYGVDLNRNFDFAWNGCAGCSSAYACALTYRGESAASEPETQSIQEYLGTIFPDVRPYDETTPAPADLSGLLISLHSYGRLVLYPWGYTSQPAPNGPALAALADRFAAQLDYRACQGGAAGCLYPTAGATDDWIYGELGVPGYTFELGTSFFQDCETYEASIAPVALESLEYALRVSVAPYRQPQGPQISEMKASPVAAAGEELEVTAVLDGPANALRLSVDQPPWLPDSVLNEYPIISSTAPATVGVSLDTTFLPAGRTLVFVQARDDHGVFGPVASQFVTITRDTAFLVDISPRRREVYVGDVVDFTVTVSNTSAITATFVLSASLDHLALTPVTPAVVPPYSAVTFEGAAVSTRGRTGADAPVLVTVCSIAQPPDCVGMSQVIIRPRIVRLPIVSRAGPATR